MLGAERQGEDSNSSSGDSDEEMAVDAAPLAEKQGPVVDEDGFQLVQSKRRGGRAAGS